MFRQCSQRVFLPKTSRPFDGQRPRPRNMFLMKFAIWCQELGYWISFWNTWKTHRFENTGTIEFSTTFGMGCLWFVIINDLFYLVSESMEMCHARKAQATWFFSAWEHCPAAKAARAGYQNFVPGCSRLFVINYTNIGIDPKQGQQETKGKKLALACINMKKKLHAHQLLVSVYMQTKMQRCTRELFTAVVHTSFVAVTVRKLFKSLRYTNIVGWRNPDHFK